jgi:2-polyprenyl-3-methyl-5-hydroxy-6-metoxy-1,4-benzoquinol methylase
MYNEQYFQDRRDPLRDAWYRSEHERIESMRPQGGAIFDVGCGLGQFLELFDSHKWQKYGVDISDYAVTLARARGIFVKNYDQGYDYPDESFDVIIFRGTIQHLDTPFLVLKRCASLLKRGGLMAFLSTPNANALCYKLFGTLPFLSPKRNYWIPSDTTLPNALRNFGLTVTQIRYPYLETPYARPLRDHLFFLLRCLGVKVSFPFWGNMMECYATKK